MTRSNARTGRGRAAFALSATMAVLLVTGCGINASQLSGGAKSTTSVSSTSTTTTTRADDPNITLPKIPQDPEKTTTTTTTSTPSTTATTNGLPAGDITPKGRTPADIEKVLTDGGATPATAACVSAAMFSQFTGDQVDQIFEVDDLDTLGSDISSRMVQIIADCGGD